MAVLRRGGTPASPCRRGTSTRLARKPGNRPDRASVLARATSLSPRTVVSIPQCLVRLSGKRARSLKAPILVEATQTTPPPTPPRPTPAPPGRRGTSTRLAGKPGNRPDRASVLARATSWSPRTVVSIPQCLVRLSGKRARRLKEQDIDEALRNTPDPRPARHLAAQRAGS